MPTYRVTYVDSVLCEAFVDAENGHKAEIIGRQQMENAEHHHAVDAWNDDWQAQPRAAAHVFNHCCFECGQGRE